MDPIIGIDLDNTIINFDQLIFSVSRDLGYIDKTIPQNKKYIRDKIRDLDNGDTKWQEVQSIVYGVRIKEAKIFTGVKNFLRFTKSQNIPTYIVSHKKLFTSYSGNRIKLRDAAFEFLNQNSIIYNQIGLVSVDHIYFEDSRENKIKRIIKLKCNYFIDDLSETFYHVMFPKKVNKLLFDPHHSYPMLPGIIICHSWKEIYEFFIKQ
jgi:hypothetical protein